MSRRNPMNDRYVMEKDKQGVSRKSVASVKPKAKAGESTNFVSGKPRKKSGLARLFSRDKSEEQEQAVEEPKLGPHSSERLLREEYKKWDVWRRRCVIISFLLVFVALSYPFTVYEPNDQTQLTSMVLWVLPFGAIGVGIYISYAKQRPIGRVLGIGYGNEGRNKKRTMTKEQREKQRREYTKQEQKVAARVEEKERRTQERAERRKANKAAEEARKEQYRAAGQAKNKK